MLDHVESMDEDFIDYYQAESPEAVKEQWLAAAKAAGWSDATIASTTFKITEAPDKARFFPSSSI